MKLTARYELIKFYETMIDPPQLIEVELSDAEANNLKKLILHYKIDETYLGELGWFLVKAKKLAFTKKNESKKLKELLEKWYLGQTYFQVVDKMEISETEKDSLYNKKIKEVKSLSENKIIAMARKTAKDLIKFEKVFHINSDIKEISFGFANGEQIELKDILDGVESTFVQRLIKDALFERFVNKTAYEYKKKNKTYKYLTAKDGKRAEIDKEIKSLTITPPTLTKIIEMVGIDDQKKNKQLRESYLKEKEFISKFYQFLATRTELNSENKFVDTFPSLKSEYAVNNFIAGVLHFAGYDFNISNGIDFVIGKNNQEYMEYVQKRVGDDMFSANLWHLRKQQNKS